MKNELPKGINEAGKFYGFDFYYNYRRIRTVTVIPFTPENLSKASKLLLAFKLDLERNTFFVANYRGKFKITVLIAQLDSHYALKQKEVPMNKLIEEQMVRYQQMVNAGNLSVATFDCYRYAVNLHLLPFFKGVQVNKVDLILVEELISKLPFTRKRVKAILRPLKEALKKAKKVGLIETNPVEQLDKEVFSIHTVTSDYEVNPFTQDEVQAILDNCIHLSVRNLIKTGFNTGMRIGELFALTWNDINFTDEIIRVDKAASIKGIIKEPKTKAGVRDIEMIPEAKDALLQQYKISGKINARVFVSPMGKNWTKTDALGRYWKDALTRAGVEYRNPYQMRHTFISRMLELGNSPMVLYPMVGHSNAGIIYQKYARFIKKTGKILKLDS